jgi:DNA-binding LytR/AlgR family response regulator
MTKIAIVEDEKEAAETLLSYLKRFAGEHGLLFDLAVYSNPLTFLEEYDPDTDIVFMDILLPDLNGMEASKRLRAIDGDVTIIFVTNLASYAIKGYEVEALDFIVKPISYDNFSLKLQRAIDRLKANDDASITVATAEGSFVIPISAITYVEVRGHVVQIHTEKKIYVTYGTLKKLESQLNPDVFVRCNSCYLVNLRYVQAIKDFTVSVAGEDLQISHPKKKDFVSSLNEFLGRGYHV